MLETVIVGIVENVHWVWSHRYLRLWKGVFSKYSKRDKCTFLASIIRNAKEGFEIKK